MLAGDIGFKASSEGLDVCPYPVVKSRVDLRYVGGLVLFTEKAHDVLIAHIPPLRRHQIEHTPLTYLMIVNYGYR
jgi:hypothetical protein